MARPLFDASYELSTQFQKRNNKTSPRSKHFLYAYWHLQFVSSTVSEVHKSSFMKPKLRVAHLVRKLSIFYGPEDTVFTRAPIPRYQNSALAFTAYFFRPILILSPFCDRKNVDSAAIGTSGFSSARARSWDQ